MIEQGNADYFTSSREAPSERDVVWRWRRIAGRMVVTGDDPGSICEDGRPEHFSGLCSGYGYVVQPLESQRRASLTVHGRNIISPALSIATDPVGASL